MEHSASVNVKTAPTPDGDADAMRRLAQDAALTRRVRPGRDLRLCQLRRRRLRACDVGQGRLPHPVRGRDSHIQCGEWGGDTNLLYCNASGVSFSPKFSFFEGDVKLPRPSFADYFSWLPPEDAAGTNGSTPCFGNMNSHGSGFCNALPNTQGG